MRRRGHTSIDSSDNVIDGRDLSARIEYLKGEQQTDPDFDEGDELKALEAFADQLPDEILIHGETLIHERYFEDYARELAEDCGMLKGGESWPYTCIDWGKAAEELQMDYSSAEFDGATYWYRS